MRNDAELWQARVDLATICRWAYRKGFQSGVGNHFSLMVPGTDDQFLVTPNGLYWSEVTASNLVKVSMDAGLDETAGVNRPGFILHSGILRARPDVNCSIHIHTEVGVAISGRKEGLDRKSTRLNSSHIPLSRMPSSA